MSKIRFEEGNLFFINDLKIGDSILKFNGYRVGKIIYISEKFQDVIGFIPSNKEYKSISEAIDDKDITFNNTMIYTYNNELKNGNWKIIGTQNILPEETNLTMRRVANIVMIKDTHIRICTDEDYTLYKNQRIAGVGAVHYYLTNLDKLD